MPYYPTPFGAFVIGLVIFVILYYYRRSLKMTSLIYDVFQMFFGAFTAISGLMWNSEAVRFALYASPVNMISTLIIYFFIIFGFISGVKTYKPKLIQSLSDPFIRTLLIFFVAMSASFVFLYVTNFVNYVSYTQGVEASIRLFSSLFLFGTVSGVVGAIITDVLSG